MEARTRLLQRDVVVGRPGFTAVALSVDSQIFRGEGDFRVLLSVLSFFNLKNFNLIYFCYYVCLILGGFDLIEYTQLFKIL